MTASPAILLAASFLATPSGMQAAAFSLTTPERVVAYSGQVDFMLFAGSGPDRNRRVMQSPRDTRYGDRFRKMAVTIWSDSTNSLWSVLPSNFLGTRRERTSTPLIAVSVINYETPVQPVGEGVAGE